MFKQSLSFVEEYYNIYVVEVPVQVTFFIFITVSITVKAPYQPKTWGNVAIVSEHSINACFTEFLKEVVEYYALSFTSVLLRRLLFFLKKILKFKASDLFRLSA